MDASIASTSYVSNNFPVAAITRQRVGMGSQPKPLRNSSPAAHRAEEGGMRIGYSHFLWKTSRTSVETLVEIQSRQGFPSDRSSGDRSQSISGLLRLGIARCMRYKIDFCV